MAQDRNRNQLIDNIDPRYPDAIAFKTAGRPFSVLVVWDDWGSDPRLPSARQDIDVLLLMQQPSGKLQLIAESRQMQNGRGEPVEFVVRDDLPAGQVLFLALHLKRVDRPVRTHVFVQVERG